MNSFIAKSTRELVICPSFDGKITSEPNKTGSLTVFSKPLDWLMDTDKKSTLNLTRSFRAGGISCRFFEKVVFIYEQEKQKISPEEAKIQEFEISENLMNLITKFQDEVHDTAISYHRKLRDESITKSELDDIKGIGEAKKKALLKYFGSVEKIRNSSIEEIVKVNGINGELAKNILQQLN